MNNQKGTLKKVVIGILNIVFMCFYMVCSVFVAILFTTPLMKDVSGTGRNYSWVFVILYACIALLFLACAVSNIITMARLKRNPHDIKAIKNQEKEKKIFKILMILPICIPLLIYSIIF